MAEAAELEFDRSVLGKEVEVGRLEVRREHILAFCQAVGETNPLYTDEREAATGPYGGIIAPPVFYACIPVQQGLDPKVTFGNTILNAGQHC
ncbi:MAG TPA: MaoC family dehydratase N-terminal domain-containing protein, partial [Dehalococcoidia bacterium]|nr:MaoC family dehydratase N-terminal domain-containing protein [Dehalococcoidia bacterium]